MKTILITILLTFSTSILANQTKIQIAAYSKQASAEQAQLQLNELLKKDLEKNNLKSVIKKSGIYHIVHIETFNDKSIQTEILSKLKKTQFNDAYVLQIVPKKKDTEKAISETNIDNIKNETLKKEYNKDIAKEEDTEKAVSEINVDNIKNETSQKEYVRDIPKYVVCLKTTALINSKNAFYIIGNEKYGMMQKSWAFSTKSAAQEYANRSGGSIVDYNTYVKMDDEAVKKYVKEHGIVIAKDTNITKTLKSDSNKKNSIDFDKYSKPTQKGNINDIYSKENLNKYR